MTLVNSFRKGGRDTYLCVRMGEGVHKMYEVQQKGG